MERAPNYEDEDASARFHRRVVPGRERTSAGKRLTSSEDYDVKNKKPVLEYFKTNLLFTIETEEPELPERLEEGTWVAHVDFPKKDRGDLPGGADRGATACR